MKKLFSLLFGALAFCVVAQESVHKPLPSAAPVVNKDGTVTFVLKADKASDVKLEGKLFGGVVEPLYDETAEAFVFTTPEPLAPDYYTYKYILNGVPVTDPGNAYTVRDIASLMNYFIIRGDGSDKGSIVGDSDAPHGTVSSVWYQSDAFNQPRRLTVYLPADYASVPDKRFPVLYLLHGSGGDETAWMDLGRASRILDNLIAKGLAEPMIVVMPNGNFNHQAAPGMGPEGEYQPTGSSLDTMKGSWEAAFPEIVEYVDSAYRTVPDAESRALAGLSMGGYQTMTISREFPDLFGYAGLFSAATLSHFPRLQELYGDTNAKLRAQAAGPLKLYWIGIGKDDFLYGANVDFRRQLDELDFPYEYHESDGGHEWANWRDYLILFVPRLFK